MTDEWVIPSIQCKMVVSGHKPMRKVDVLSFILIDFYVPALTSRFNSIETLLQLSETEHQFTNSFLLLPLRTGRGENIVPNNFSIVACISVVCRAVSQQWTTPLAPLFRLSGVMSQYLPNGI
jgi:hypothetical protein